MSERVFLGIDARRRLGHGPEEIGADLERRFGEHEAARLVAQYRESKLPDGRSRGRVNLGDPAEAAPVGLSGLFKRS